MIEENHITENLVAWNNGKSNSLDHLIPLVENELRRIAHNYMRREDPNHTLQTTALINEAYIELNGQHSVNWKNRKHFYAISAQIMRRILLKHARDRSCQKRGGNAIQVGLEEAWLISIERSKELMALDEALTKLAQIDPFKSCIVEMRYFGGLTTDEIARALGYASITIAVNWRAAKAWLGREIKGQNPTKHASYV